jgi:hypothetical protein
MRKRFSDIRNIKLFTADDTSLRPIGEIEDLLVEDGSWDVRYIVVSTDAPLSRRVLISPAAIHGFDFEAQSMGTMLTAQQIVDSPPEASDRPISREYEQALVNYYGWPIYWLGRAFAKPQALETIAADAATQAVNETTDSNLRSANEICGYQIKSNDSPAGFMKDLIIHMESWKVDYAMAEAKSWLLKEGSLFSTEWIRKIDWANRIVHIDLTKPALEAATDSRTFPLNTGQPLLARPFRLS